MQTKGETLALIAKNMEYQKNSFNRFSVTSQTSPAKPFQSVEFYSIEKRFKIYFPKAINVLC